MDIVQLTIPAVLLMGLAFGAGPCNVTCLPYLGPVLLQGEGVKSSWKILVPFTLGRLTGYSSLGLIAGLAGQLLVDWLQSSLAGWILGLAAIAVGIRLFVKRSDNTACHSISPQQQTIHFHKQASTQPTATKSLLPGALFLMGVGMALNPCVPLATVLAAAATGGSMLLGVSLGLSFGVGAVILPTLFFGILIAHFGTELRNNLGQWKHHIEKFSGSLLILLGLATTAGWIQP